MKRKCKIGSGSGSADHGQMSQNRKLVDSDLGSGCLGELDPCPSAHEDNACEEL